ncbi:MAG: heparinase II/III-family protein, partial [Armatimonadota bacterium]|nr:heparinase II/III-family protein [Armatimonadota bacterium]
RPYVPEDYYAAEYLHNTHLFRMYMAGPEMRTCANFGDGPPRDWHAIRPIMYRLASEYGDGRTQWLAEQLPDRDDVDALCWSLLWYDAALDVERPDDLPLWRAFEEAGFGAARTSWAEEALTLHLRSGRAAVSHSHLDVNNFLLNAGGEWLLRDYGYGKVGEGYFNRDVTYFSNSTAAHNCLVIGGRDQGKDADSIGTITDAAEMNGLIWLRSEATKAYQGAESVVRELALVLPHEGTGKWGYVVVRDRAQTAAPETFDFMLNPGGEVVVNGDTFTIQCEQSRLMGKVIAPSAVTIEVLPGIGEHINVEDPRCLRIRAPEKASEVEFIVVLVPLADGEEAPEIAAVGSGVSGASVGGESVVFSAGGTEPPRRKASQG